MQENFIQKKKEQGARALFFRKNQLPMKPVELNLVFTSRPEKHRALYIHMCKVSDEVMFQKHKPGSFKKLPGILSAP